MTYGCVCSGYVVGNSMGMLLFMLWYTWCQYVHSGNWYNHFLQPVKQNGPVFSLSSLMSMVCRVCWQSSGCWYKHQLIHLFVWSDGRTIDVCMSMLSPKAWTQLARNFELAGKTKNSLSVCVCLSLSLSSPIFLRLSLSLLFVSLSLCLSVPLSLCLFVSLSLSLSLSRVLPSLSQFLPSFSPLPPPFSVSLTFIFSLFLPLSCISIARSLSFLFLFYLSFITHFQSIFLSLPLSLSSLSSSLFLSFSLSSITFFFSISLFSSSISLFPSFMSLFLSYISLSLSPFLFCCVSLYLSLKITVQNSTQGTIKLYSVGISQTQSTRLRFFF